MLAAVAVDALKLAIPLAKAIPLVGNVVEGSLAAALYIVEVRNVRPSVLLSRLQSNLESTGRQDEEGEMQAFG